MRLPTGEETLCHVYINGQDMGHTCVSVTREQRAKSHASEGNFLVLTREAVSSRTEKVIGSWQDSVTLHG